MVTLAGRGKGGDCKEVQQATFSGGSALCTLAQFSFAGKSEKKKFCFSFPVVDKEEAYGQHLPQCHNLLKPPASLKFDEQNF